MVLYGMRHITPVTTRVSKIFPVFQKFFNFNFINMLDIELLINEIEKEECLWNINNANYMDKHCKSKSWINVASAVFGNWDTFSNKDQEIHGKHI